MSWYIAVVTANVYDVTNEIDLGSKKIYFPTTDGTEEYHKSMSGTITSPAPTLGQYLKVNGLEKLSCFRNLRVDSYPPSGYDQKSLWDFGPTNYLLSLGVNSVYKLVFEGLDGNKYILVKMGTNAINFEYYIDDINIGSIYSLSNECYFRSSGGIRIGSAGAGVMPFLTVDRTRYIQTNNTWIVEYRASYGAVYPTSANIWMYTVDTQAYVNTLKQFWGDFEPDIPDDNNPYWNGGISEEGGGDGNFSDDSDNPEADDLPEIGAIGTGFATIFKPSLSQLRSLSELFWNSNVFTFLQNLVENITDMFTSLAMVPFEVTAGNTVSVTWLGIDTAISLTLASKQYYEFDMGSINLADDSRIFTSGSALDYSPFSTLGIYLPFIGYQELDIDECRGAVVNLRYRVDILSGTCVAIIKVAGRDIYQFTGNCLTQIPITNENMQSLVSDAVNVGIAMAGAQAAKGTMGAVEDNIQSSGMSADKSELAMAHANASLGHSESRLASATANIMSSGKPSFKKSGAISSSASMFAVKQPYLFLTTPRQSIPERYQRYCGFPSNITGTLGSFSGYTVVEDIRLNDLVATSPEVAEIYQLLKQGVIV